MDNLYILKNPVTDTIVAIYSDYEIAEEDRNFLTTTNENTYNIILYSTTDINPNRYLERGEVQ